MLATVSEFPDESYWRFNVQGELEHPVPSVPPLKATLKILSDPPPPTPRFAKFSAELAAKVFAESKSKNKYFMKTS